MEDLTETDLLKKTFSTFHASNMLLQQQYRDRKFTKFSELITMLAEKNNRLLIKIHQSHLIGSQHFPLPEANTSAFCGSNHRNQNNERGRGGWSEPKARGRQDQGPPRVETRLKPCPLSQKGPKL